MYMYALISKTYTYTHSYDYACGQYVGGANLDCVVSILTWLPLIVVHMYVQCTSPSTSCSHVLDLT